MNVKLLDYAGKSIFVDVGDIDTIESMMITVISGDEILTVSYKNGTEETFDSSDSRIMDFYDGEYAIYDEKAGINGFDNEEFMNRNTSYWYIYKD